MQYKVVSDRCTVAKKGATVSESELEGLNLEVLVEAGHIAPVNAKSSKTVTDTEGE